MLTQAKPTELQGLVKDRPDPMEIPIGTHYTASNAGEPGRTVTQDPGNPSLRVWTADRAEPTGAAGGDLAGTYPDPTVAGVHGRPWDSALPLDGQVFAWSNALQLFELVSPSSAPSGPAGGDLSGNYPDPDVAGLEGVPLDTAAAVNGDMLVYNAGVPAWESSRTLLNGFILPNAVAILGTLLNGSTFNLFNITATNALQISVGSGGPSIVQLAASSQLQLMIGSLSRLTITSTTINAANADVLISQKLRTSSSDSSGTPGNATINEPSGRSAVAAGNSSVTITNSQVTAAAHVFAQISQAAADATASQVVRVVPAAGSFVVHLDAAATGAVVFDWFVLAS